MVRISADLTMVLVGRLEEAGGQKNYGNRWDCFSGKLRMKTNEKRN